jgi:flagella basal body P-ring formation protein FlgA
MHFNSVWSVCCCLILLWSPAALGLQVEIRFRRPAVSLTTDLVRLQDVAEISGGDHAIRLTIAKLDLDMFQSDQTTMEITAELVRYRILLAGISDSKFHVQPGSSTKVYHWQPNKINQLLEQLLSSQFLELYQVPADDLEIKLVSRLDEEVIRSGIDLHSVKLATVLPPELTFGQRNVPLTISDAHGNSLNINAVCRVIGYRDVARVRSPVFRGEALSEQNVERVRRPILSSSIQLASYDEVIGRKAQNDLQPQTLVNHQAVRERPWSSNQLNSIVVKRNDLVNVTVSHGILFATLKNAKANANGRIGETIPFVHPITGKTIYARVLDAQSAIIQP